MKKRQDKVNSFKTSEVTFLVVLTCLLSFVMAYLLCNRKNSIKYDTLDNSLNSFLKEYQNIIDNYYGDIDKQKLMEGAIKGMIESLDDPYATYFDENEANNFNIKLNGKFEGFGVEIIKLSDGEISIITVFDDSPASKAGLKVGDVIISIDGRSTLDLTTTEFSSLVANSNNQMNLVVNRNNQELNFTLHKGTVEIQSVSSKIVTQENKKIGYISVSIFALNTYDQFKKHLDQLESEKIDSLIIDLRDNPGGHSIIAEKILSLFLSSNKIIYQIKGHDGVEKKYSTGKTNKNYPIVVLVNSNSASASEIVTSALKEQLGATVVGKKTYGKGTVQNLIELPSGEEYKFTTKLWLTSKGNSINEVGVLPDVEIDDSNTLEDVYMNKALEILGK